DNTNNGYYYIGSLIYASSSGKLQIESTNFAGGRINIVENTLTNTFSQDIQYHHKDHLGSVRAITDNSGSVIEQNAYYPFGGRHTFGNTYAQTTNRFKFNGKEEQTAGNLGLLDYGARMYDANIGRWFVQDPLAEENISFSSYNYVSNNPISRIDYKGLLDDWVENKNGVIYWDEYAYSPETTEEGYVYLGPIVVVFNGSTDETLGTKTDSKHLNGYLDGTDAETAEVIVYGPNGEQDI
ncbi:MAG: RHS repeat-associated core domain-containing protein, partial [Alphaproteobacteria bacterium]|nr:RHS repeat-associated core domain-containing protein [Alphaproteobacteria bacterium]